MLWQSRRQDPPCLHQYAATLAQSHVFFICDVYFCCKVVVLATEVDESDEENLECS